MSELINNREFRKNTIKELLRMLHDGHDLNEVRERFAQAFSGVSPSEISEAEQALMAEGVPLEEVQKLCDIHAAAFTGIIQPAPSAPAVLAPGHPAWVLSEENAAIGALLDRIESLLQRFSSGAETALPPELRKALGDLRQVELHYMKKENLLFPYLEAHGITAPPKVMWGVDDEIRAAIKEALVAAETGGQDRAGLDKAVRTALEKIREMIFKEDNILRPMLLETLTQEEWARIAEEGAELGFCLIPPPPLWKPADARQAVPTAPASGDIRLPTGVFSTAELTHLLDTLPVDITFVDKDDTVKYFSQSAERIFPRTKAIIGRKVSNCHPPASVHVVEAIVEAFKSGKKDHEDFWITLGDKFVLIRYFAVRDSSGAYLGTLEVTQNIAPIQKISGEKRLLSEHVEQPD